MKEYNIYNKFYILGLNNNKYNYINYYLYYKYHGFYYHASLNNNQLIISKGYFNKGIKCNHWNANYKQYLYRYYL